VHEDPSSPQVKQLRLAEACRYPASGSDGHQNDLKDIGGIRYCTLVAMVEGSGVENNGYSVMEIAPDGRIRLTGFRNQKGYDWQQNA
jgi:alkaline phosphatase